MIEGTDHREILFDDYRKSMQALREVRREIEELNETLNDKKNTAYQLEMSANRLKDVIDDVIIDGCDPVIARLKSIEKEDKPKRSVRLSPGVYVTETDTAIIDLSPRKTGKIRRMIALVKEIWKNA